MTPNQKTRLLECLRAVQDIRTGDSVTFDDWLEKVVGLVATMLAEESASEAVASLMPPEKRERVTDGELARLAAHATASLEGYAVHVVCGGEVESVGRQTSGWCHGCNRTVVVTRNDVVRPNSAVDGESLARVLVELQELRAEVELADEVLRGAT